MPRIINTISLYNPHAMLVGLGLKLNETRSWPTKYRGLIAIHASRKMTPFLDRLCFEEPFKKALVDAGYIKGKEWVKPHPMGAVIATCNLVNCVEIDADFLWKQTRQEVIFGDYTLGRYAWILQNARLLPEPIPAKGQLSIWKWQVPEGIEIPEVAANGYNSHGRKD